MDAFPFRPLADRVVVRESTETEDKVGSLYLPDQSKEAPQEALVLAVGPGTRTDRGQQRPMEVKVGDLVMFGKYSGTNIEIDGEELLILKESDILGIITGPRPRPGA